MDLSIVIPGIRPDRWGRVLESIRNSCSKEYEVLFIGPVKPQEAPECCDADNVRVIEDLASPNICQHKAMSYTKGDVLHIFSDDCLFEKDAIDRCMDAMEGYDAVVANYDEGGNCAVPDFSLNHCYAKTATPDSFVIFNTAFMRRQRFFDLGGFDCNYETLCVAQADLAARWQYEGFSVKVENIKLSACGHMPGTSGDHGPMHWAQILNDIPYYKYAHRFQPYSNKVDYDNYKKQPEVWSRRFA